MFGGFFSVFFSLKNGSRLTFAAEKSLFHPPEASDKQQFKIMTLYFFIFDTNESIFKMTS